MLLLSSTHHVTKYKNTQSQIPTNLHTHTHTHTHTYTCTHHTHTHTHTHANKRKQTHAHTHVQEHEMVVKTLEPMDKSRKCFRLISEVLVERTTGETLPAVQKNKEALEEVVKKLHEGMQRQEKELGEYQVRCVCVCVCVCRKHWKRW